MLKSLHVRNYVLIDSLDIDFPGGLIIITGQTGAGKSILLGALSLLLGGKADASVISAGADSCVVEAEFDTEDNAIRELLEENEVEWGDGALLVRRVVHSSGRSRSFVNDCPVPVGLLSSVSSSLVDIHSQHQSLLLNDRRFQLAALDFYAGNAELLESCGAEWRRVQTLKTEIDRLQERLERAVSEKEYTEAQFKTLDAARLKDGELVELEEEQAQLANAEQIKECLFAVEELGLAASIKDAARMLEKAGKYVPAVADLHRRFDSARIELDDILGEVSSINERLEVSADRLQTVEDRMSVIYGLLKRFRCSSEKDLIDLKDSLSANLCDSSVMEEKLEALRSDLNGAMTSLKGLSDALHSSRVAASASFAAEIEKSIHFLELEQAVFDVDISPVPMSASGEDAVSFRFSATGGVPSDVAKCASGGELSRIMLCLKALMARFTNMPTIVFDEIDTGVSGSVADKMGSMICGMGKNMQVLAITHLPQVAAKGDAHYLVEKSLEGGRAVTTIKELSPEERVLELARMLSGAVVTDAAVANARVLLGQ